MSITIKVTQLLTLKVTLAVNNLRFIPAHRMKDVVYFNPADTAFPLGFNPMEVHDPSMKK